jgi:hypothetical protein
MLGSEEGMSWLLPRSGFRLDGAECGPCSGGGALLIAGYDSFSAISGVFRLDLDTGIASLVGSLDPFVPPGAIAVEGDGQILVASGHWLVRMDPMSGATTTVSEDGSFSSYSSPTALVLVRQNAPVLPVPTLGARGLGVLGLGLGMFGWAAIVRRRASTGASHSVLLVAVILLLGCGLAGASAAQVAPLAQSRSVSSTSHFHGTFTAPVPPTQCGAPPFFGRGDSVRGRRAGRGGCRRATPR